MTWFDTHAHLNFKRFKKDVDAVIQQIRDADFSGIVIPGTDVVSSKRAVELAENNDRIYAAVGIHPHHSPRAQSGLINEKDIPDVPGMLADIENIIASHREISDKKIIVAIGEIGLDRHVYEETKYEHYSVDEAFIEEQKELFRRQIELAKKYNLSVIVHNREAINDLLPLLNELWDDCFSGRMVFHCCEPLQELLDFAVAHRVYIGIDGDITYATAEALQKREFIAKVPDELLVLETDSPFLLPEPLRSEKKYPNTPLNIHLVGEFVAQCRNQTVEDVQKMTAENAHKLFGM